MCIWPRCCGLFDLSCVKYTSEGWEQGYQWFQNTNTQLANRTAKEAGVTVGRLRSFGRPFPLGDFFVVQKFERNPANQYAVSVQLRRQDDGTLQKEFSAVTNTIVGTSSPALFSAFGHIGESLARIGFLAFRYDDGDTEVIEYAWEWDIDGNVTPVVASLGTIEGIVSHHCISLQMIKICCGTEVWEYDPETGSFSEVATLPSAASVGFSDVGQYAFNHEIVRVSDGKAYNLRTLSLSGSVSPESIRQVGLDAYNYTVDTDGSVVKPVDVNGYGLFDGALSWDIRSFQDGNIEFSTIDEEWDISRFLESVSYYGTNYGGGASFSSHSVPVFRDGVNELMGCYYSYNIGLATKDLSLHILNRHSIMCLLRRTYLSEPYQLFPYGNISMILHGSERIIICGPQVSGSKRSHYLTATVTLS